MVGRGEPGPPRCYRLVLVFEERHHLIDHFSPKGLIVVGVGLDVIPEGLPVRDLRGQPAFIIGIDRLGTVASTASPYGRTRDRRRNRTDVPVLDRIGAGHPEASGERCQGYSSG